MVIAIFLGTIIPLLFLINILEGENKLVMSFFSWGLIAFIISLKLNTTIVHSFGLSANLLSYTWAPLLEEFFKALPLIYFLIYSKDKEYSIIYFAMAAGIGFSIQENYLYLINNIGDKGTPILYIIVRSITTCLMHGISSTIIGYGIITIRRLRVMVLPMLFGLFTIAVIFHSLFNLYINSSLRLLGMVLPIMIYVLCILFFNPDDKDYKNDKI